MMSEKKKLLTKEQILTIPNALSLFRLILVPFIVIFYVKGNIWASVICIAVSGLTDLFDGKIARRFNQMSDVGKMLDPLADKITMGAIIIALASRFKLMIPFIIVFALCECLKGLASVYTFKRVEKVTSSIMAGKVETFFMYIAFGLLFLFPNMPSWLSAALIIVSMALAVYALAAYVVYYRGLIKKNDAGRGKTN